MKKLEIVTKTPRPARKGMPHVYNPDRGIPFNGSYYSSIRRNRPDIDTLFDAISSMTLNPNRGTEDITDIHKSMNGNYYLSFQEGKQQTVAEWKKTLKEKEDIHIVESGERAIAFSDESSLNKTLNLMVENKFIKTNFFAASNAAKRLVR